MKKTQLISLSSYCDKATAWDIQDLIKAAVNREDIINHTYVHPKIPKNMTYPKMRINRITAHSFFSKILP